MSRRKLKENEKYGFVYIWRDSKHNRYYIGSHWGTEDDGYVCSSFWMKQAYKHRPLDFKRKILKTNIKSINEQFFEENKWLSLIKKEEIGKRYYNLHNIAGHWSQNKEKYKIIVEKSSKRKHSDETKEKLRKINLGKTYTDETKEKHRQRGLKRFEDPLERLKISEKMKGRIVSEETKEKISKKIIGKVNVKDINNNRFSVSIDDPRYISGELISANKGSFKPRVSPNKGKKASEETRKKQSESAKRRYFKEK